MYSGTVFQVLCLPGTVCLLISGALCPVIDWALPVGCFCLRAVARESLSGAQCLDDPHGHFSGTFFLVHFSGPVFWVELSGLAFWTP